MKTAEFFIAGAAFINAMCTDSASSVAICGLMFWLSYKRMMAQLETTEAKRTDKRYWDWQQCIIPARKED